MRIPALLLFGCGLLPTVSASPQAERTAAEWDQVALTYGAAGDTDGEMRAWLEALRLEDSDRRRLELGRLAEPRSRVRVTVQHEGANLFSDLDLAMSLDGKLLATAEEQMQVWDAYSGQRLWEVDGERGPCFSADGLRLASCSPTRVRVREARSGKLVRSFDGTKEDRFSRVYLGPLGRTLVAVGNDFYWIWDVPSGELLAGPEPGWLWEPVFTRDGQRMASNFSGPDDGPAGPLLWSREQGVQLLDYAHGPVAFDPTETRLAAVRGGSVRMLDLETMEWTDEIFPVTDLAMKIVFPSQDMLACSGYGYSWLWNADTRQLRGATTSQGDLYSDQRDKYANWPTPLSPDGSRHAQGGIGDTLRIWSLESGAPIADPILHGAQVDLAVFGRDASVLACASQSGLVRVWEVPSAEPPAAKFPPGNATVERTPAGVKVSAEQVAFWLLDLTTGHQRRLGLMDGFSHALTFDAAGERVVLRSFKGEVRVVDLEGRLSAAPITHELALSAYLIDQELTILDYDQSTTWDLNTGRPVGIRLIEEGDYRVNSSGLACVWDADQASTRNLIDGTKNTYEPQRGWISDVHPTARLVLTQEGPDVALSEFAGGRELGRRWHDDLSVELATVGDAVLMWDEQELLIWRMNQEDQRLTLPLSPAPTKGAKFAGAPERLLCFSESKVWLLNSEGEWEPTQVSVDPGLVTMDAAGRWLVWATDAPRVSEIQLPLAAAAAVADSAATASEPAVGPYACALPVAISARGTLAWRTGSGNRVWLHEYGQARTSTYFQARAMAWSASDVLWALGPEGALHVEDKIYIPAEPSERLAVHPDGRHCALVQGTQVHLSKALPVKPSGEQMVDAPIAFAGRLFGYPLEYGVSVDLGGAPITALAFSQDGAELLVASQDGLVRWLDTAGLEPLRAPTELAQAAHALVDLGSEVWLVGDASGVYRLGGDGRRWNTPSMILALGPNPTGWVAAAADGNLYQWNEELDEFFNHELERDTNVPAVTLSVLDPTGERLACVFKEGSVSVTHAQDGTLFGPPILVEGRVRELRFASQGEQLIIVTEDGVRGWDIASGTPRGHAWHDGVVLPGEPMVWAGQDGWRSLLIRVEDSLELWSAPIHIGIDTSVIRMHPDGEHVLFHNSIHATLLRVVDGSEVEILGTRRWPQFGSGKALEFLENQRVLVGVDLHNSPPTPRVLDFTDPGTIRLDGTPEHLIGEWERRLGWTVVEGELVRRGP